MELRIDPLEYAVSSGNWSDNVSGMLAHCDERESGASIEEGLVREWVWSRTATKVALLRAGALPEGQERQEALRLAARHNGVWRSANKMVRHGAPGKKQARCIVAVRADAGDISCTSWMRRHAAKQVHRFAPIAQACHKLGYSIGKACIGPISRVHAAKLVRELASCAIRVALDAGGFDIHVVPAISNLSLQVNVHVIGAFKNELPTIHVPFSGEIIEFKNALVTWDAAFNEMHTTAYNAGADAWTNMLIDTASVKLRSRVTCGIFYGQAAVDAVAKAAVIVEKELSKQLADEVSSAKQRVELALAIVKDAAEAGDLNNAVRALQFAKCYIGDVLPSLTDAYPVVRQALINLGYFDLTGISNCPVLKSINDAFEARLAQLPLPLPRTASVPWQCVEHVKIHSAADIHKLVLWVKEDQLCD